MKVAIHPTARVHPSCILEGNIEIGPETTIGPLTVILGDVHIGARNRIGPHVVIGTDGEHRLKPPVGFIRIHDDNEIREFSCIQRGTGDRETQVGSRCYIMDHVHIAHDVFIDDDVTVSPNVVFGGHTVVQKGATVGIGAMTHQHSTVGAFAMIGMGSVVTSDVPPFFLCAGNPARFMRLNQHQLDKHGFDARAIDMSVEQLTSNDDTLRGYFMEFYRHARRKVMQHSHKSKS